MLNKDLANVELTFSKMDSERLATLTTEVQARLDEIRKITAAALAIEPDALKVKFQPETKTFFTGMHIEIIELPDTTSCCVVWENWPHGSAKLFCPC